MVSPPVPTIEKSPAVPEPVSREPVMPSRPTDPPVTSLPGIKEPRTRPWFHHRFPRLRKVLLFRNLCPGNTPYHPGSADPPVIKPAGDKRTLNPVVVTPQVHTAGKRAVILQPVAGDDPEVTAISQIRDMEGIVAISVFNDSGTVLMKGDADNEAMVKIAQTMLETSKKITPLLTWGPFVHMTIQIPSGNMIIAPYHDQLPLPAHDKDDQHRTYPEDSSRPPAKSYTSADVMIRDCF